jgi:dihydrofolate reductase
VCRNEGSKRCFVIGGAEIYKVALQRKEAKRVLLTRVEKLGVGEVEDGKPIQEFECDTFFPVKLEESQDQVEDGKGEWKKNTKEELDAWTGEKVPEGWQEEGGTRYVFEMWERQ